MRRRKLEGLAHSTARRKQFCKQGVLFSLPFSSSFSTIIFESLTAQHWTTIYLQRLMETPNALIFICQIRNISLFANYVGNPALCLVWTSLLRGRQASNCGCVRLRLRPQLAKHSPTQWAAKSLKTAVACSSPRSVNSLRNANCKKWREKKGRVGLVCLVFFPKLELLLQAQASNEKTIYNQFNRRGWRLRSAFLLLTDNANFKTYRVFNRSFSSSRERIFLRF